jgi:chorismate synthase
MSGSIFGSHFRISTFGESHGPSIGVVIDGCPAGLELNEVIIQAQLDRRRPGQSAIVTQRKESDTCHILSGVFEGKTTGSPIAIVLYNEDQRSKDYSHIKDSFRPSHGDFTWEEKFGHRDYRGGGRSSARETAARVAAGAVALQLLKTAGIEVLSFVRQVGHIRMEQIPSHLTRKSIDANDVRCPDEQAAKIMYDFIASIRKEGDTIGGIITCLIKNCPTGLGEPVFDKLHADLGKAFLSINACKGFEIGSGFQSVGMKGSEHNDVFIKEKNITRTLTNHSGGIQGGISNGMDIICHAVFKPIATIMKDQETIDKEGNPVIISGKGRHDPCVLPRAVPIVDAMAALVMADHLLRSKTNKI